MPTTPTIESLSLQVADYTNKYDAALDALPSQTDFAAVRRQVSSNTLEIGDLSAHYYKTAANIGRIDSIYSSLPKQTDFAAIQRKITDLSNNIVATIGNTITNDSQFNALIVNKLTDVSSFIQAAQNIIEGQGIIASKTNITDAINTLSSNIATRYFTISGGENISAITRQLAASIFDLSISRVTVSRFNQLDETVSSLTTTAASLTNPAGIFAEINRRALTVDLSTTNTNLANLSSYTNTINTTLSGLQTNLENNYLTNSRVSNTIADLSTNINNRITNITTDLSTNINSNSIRINEISQNTVKIVDFSGLSSFTNTISSLLYRNISDINISSVNIIITDLSSRITNTNDIRMADISSLSTAINAANRNIYDISTNFNRYYTSSQVNDISFAINTEINNINSKYTTLQGQLLIPGTAINVANSAFTLSGQYTAQTIQQLNIPNDKVQWLYIKMKGGDGDYSGNLSSGFNRGEIITGYIPIMPYDIIKFYPGKKGNIITSSDAATTTYNNVQYNGIIGINNAGAGGIKLASGAASILEINGSPVLVARGGSGSDGQQLGGGAAPGLYTTPKRDVNGTSKYFNQIIDLSQIYGSVKSTTPTDGYIEYEFRTSLNKPQFSFKYRSADASGIDSTYVDEHANFIIGSDIAPRRLIVNGLLDISGAIKNSIINAMPTAITMNAPTTLNAALTINNADKSGNIYINANGELVATAKDIRLLSSDSLLNNYTFSTIKSQFSTIESTYAKRSDLDTATVDINGVQGAFAINPNDKTVSLFNNVVSQGTLLAKTISTTNAFVQYTTVDNGSIAFNNSTVNYVDNLTVQQRNAPSTGTPNPTPTITAIFKSTGIDISGQLTVTGTSSLFANDISVNKQLKAKDITVSTINTTYIVAPTITTNSGAGNKTDISSAGISTVNITATKLTTTDISTTNISISSGFSAPLLNITNAAGKSFIKSDLTVGDISTSKTNELFVYGSAVLGSDQTRFTQDASASYIQAKSQVFFTKIDGDLTTGVNRTLIVDTSNNRIAINRAAVTGAALDVNGATNISGTLTTDLLQANNNNGHYILGKLGINKTDPSYNIDVSGSARITGNIYQSGTDFRLAFGDTSKGTTIESRALVKDNGATLVVNFANDFSGGTRIDSILTISGDTTLNKGLSVTNAAQFKQNMNISGQLVLDGSANLRNNLFVTGTTQLYNNLNISGQLDVSSTSQFRNNISVSGDVSASGNSTFNQGIYRGNLTVGGITNISGAANISGQLVVDSSANFRNRITVSGDASFNKDVTIAGKLSVNNIGITGGLAINNLGLSGDLVVDGSATFSKITTRDITITGKSSITGDFAAQALVLNRKAIIDLSFAQYSLNEFYPVFIHLADPGQSLNIFNMYFYPVNHIQDVSNLGSNWVRLTGRTTGNGADGGFLDVELMNRDFSVNFSPIMADVGIFTNMPINGGIIIWLRGKRQYQMFSDCTITNIYHGMTQLPTNYFFPYILSREVQYTLTNNTPNVGQNEIFIDTSSNNFTRLYKNTNGVARIFTISGLSIILGHQIDPASYMNIYAFSRKTSVSSHFNVDYTSIKNYAVNNSLINTYYAATDTTTPVSINSNSTNIIPNQGFTIQGIKDNKQYDNSGFLHLIGINTITPGYTLDVSGDSRIRQGLIVDNSAIFYNTIDVSAAAQFRSHVNISGQLFTDLSATFRKGIDVSNSAQFRSDINISGQLITDGAANFRKGIDVSGDIYTNSNLFIGVSGGAASGSKTNAIIFRGLSGDINTSTSYFTVISERLYGVSDKSELLLFKGNDSTTSSGPDRIRMLSTGGTIIQTANDTTTYSATNQVGPDASYNTALHIDQSGNLAIGKLSDTTYKLDVSGDSLFRNKVNISGTLTVSGDIQSLNGDFYVKNGKTLYIQDNTNSSRSMFNSTGLGINTISLTSGKILDVSGDSQLRGNVNINGQLFTDLSATFRRGIDVSGLSQISSGLIIRHPGVVNNADVSGIKPSVQPFEIRGSTDVLGNDGGALHLTAGGGTNINNQSYVKIVGLNELNTSYNNSIRLGTAGKERIRIDSDGNVIFNGTNTTSRILLGPSPGFNNYDYCSSIESENNSANNYSSKLKFFTHYGLSGNVNLIERMRIDDIGRVGIGRTDPQYILDVYGNTRLGADSSSLTGIGTAPALGASLRVGGGAIIEAGNLLVNSGKLDVSGNISSLSGELYQNGFDFHLGYNNNGRGNTLQSRALVKESGSKLVINYGPQSPSERRTDFNGGVTINGTNVDTNYINLNGGVSMEGSEFFIKPSNSTAETAVKVELTNANLCIYKNVDGTTNTNITNTAGGALKLGVGNSSDVKGIAIKNDLISLNTNVHAEKNLIIGTANAAKGASTNSIFFKGTTSDSGDVDVHTAISERIYADTEASELLLFKGNDPISSGPDRIRLLSVGGTIIQTTNNAFTYYNTTSQVGPDASYNTAVHVDSNGNVAIGKKVDDSSTYKLDVNGSMIVRTSGEIKPFTGNNTSNYVYVDVNSDSNNVRMGGYGSIGMKNLCLQVSNTDVNSGNVGIGKLNPEAQLDVDGDTIIRGNLTITGTIGGTIGGVVPIGGIIMWSGTTVPTNWALCDGSNSTPDLRGRFVIGATKNASGTNYSTKGATGIENDARGEALKYYNTGQKGGEIQHVLTIDEMPSHNHAYNDSTVTREDVNGSNFDYQGINNVYDSSRNTGNKGGDQAHNNMPPYYALAYIQRIE
jgi:microcystin-dependent protein